MFGCCKNKIYKINKFLDGKLKTVDIIYENTNEHRFLNYIYNDSGYLTGLIGDSLKFTVSIQENNTIFINVDVLASDQNFNSKQKFKILVSPLKQIQNINLLDSITQEEIPFLVFSYNNLNLIDTVNEIGNLNFVHDVANYSYLFDGNNCTQQGVSWYIYTIFGGNVYYEDTIIYRYNYSLKNDNYIPLQNPYLGTSYALLGSIDKSQILNLLEINGFSTLNRNKNLIQSISSTKYGYTTYFSYITNTLNQVTEMRISKPDGTGTALTYKMTYY